MGKGLFPIHVTPKTRPCKHFTFSGEPICSSSNPTGCPRHYLTCHFIHPEDTNWPFDERGHRKWYIEDDGSVSVNPDYGHTGPSTSPKLAKEPYSRPRKSPPLSPSLYSKSKGKGKVINRGSSPPLATMEGKPLAIDAELANELRPATSSATGTPQTGLFIPSFVQTEPPIPPTAPGFDAFDTQNEGGELTPAMQKRRRIWEERVWLLANAVTKYKELSAVKDDLNDYVQMQRLAGLHPSIAEPSDSPSPSTQLAQARAEFEARQRRLEKELQDVYDSFVDMDDTATQESTTRDSSTAVAPWPISQQDYEFNAKAQEQYRDMAKYVEELKGFVAQICEILGSAAAPPEVPTINAGAPEVNAEDAVQQNERPYPSLEPSIRQLHDRATALKGVDEKTRDTVEKLEGHIAHVENQLLQQEDAFTEAVEGRVGEVLEELMERFGLNEGNLSGTVNGVDASVALSSQTGGQVPAAPATASDIIHRARQLESDMSQANRDVAEMKGYMEDWSRRLDAVETLRAQIVERNEMANETKRWQENQARIATLSTSAESQSHRLAALEAALHAHLERPPTPPASPVALPTEILMKVLEEPLTHAMRACVQPVVEEFRVGVVQQMQAEANMLLGDVWNKMRPTMGVLGAMEEKLDSSSSHGKKIA